VKSPGTNALESGREGQAIERAAEGAPVRILALDVGARRIGLAVSDELGWTAQGLETLERSNARQDLARLAQLAAGLGVSQLLIGNPKSLSGREGRQSERVKEFGDRLARQTGLTAVYWDERWTSVEAERALRGAGKRTRAQRTGAVDRLAATLLLDSYLQWLAWQRNARGADSA